MNIAGLLQKTAAARPRSIAVVDHDEPTLDYGGLAARVAAIAGCLRDVVGLNPGDRVALIMKNCPQYIEILLGVLHAGLAAVPVNAKLHAKEFEFILADSGAACVFTTSDFKEMLSGFTPASLALISVDDPAYAEVISHRGCALYPSDPDDLAWLFYTSGTTGLPKGAMISHRNLLVMTQSYFSSVDTIEPGDNLLHVAPMSHGSGLYIFPAIARGARQVISRSGGFDEAEIFELFRLHDDVFMFAAPTMIHRLVRSNWPYDVASSGLKSIIYGGGPMYVADIVAAIDKFGDKFVQIYGQGETPMTITCLSRADHGGDPGPARDARLASVGRAQMPVQVEVRGAGGTALPAGEIGEIVVKGDTVMLGYWGNPDASADAIRDGWLYTGDMGVLSAEGYLTLKDRSKDLIISGGTNIYPREVEEVLLRHAEISEVAVVGRSDPEWGEVVVAFVVSTGALTSAACDAWCLANMARFKRPKAYHFVGELPKNNTGKVLKRELRSRLN
jgi:long-chain acyl-CoA synthetase